MDRRRHIMEDLWITEPCEGGLVIIGYTGSDTEVEIPAVIDGRPVVGIQGDEDPDDGDRYLRCIFNYNVQDKPVTHVSISNGVSFIGKSAFEDAGITSVSIPPSVTSIGERAFTDNFNLKDITLPPNLTHIGDAAFARCWDLSSLIIPDSVTSIGRAAFVESELSIITIPTNVSLGTQEGPAFLYGFDAFYARNGKKAGTYVCRTGDGYNLEGGWAVAEFSSDGIWLLVRGEMWLHRY
jgi:hypothetical protein